MKSPFKFLNPYEQKDKNIFFGRDDEIKELYQMVFQTNLLLVYGLSGTGKTSLVQCGLAGKFDGPEWHPFFIRRQNNILDSIGQTFKPYLDGEHKTMLESVKSIYNKYFRPVYLIFDQFEEIFILGKPAEQQEFIGQLKELLDAHIPCKVIIVMREEYIGQLYAFEKEIPTLRDFRFRVEQMGMQKVQQVIASTFGAFNVRIEEPKDELLDQMVQNISDEKSGIALPYVQVYMDVLYREGTRDIKPGEVTEGEYPEVTITREDIRNAGEIEDVLGNFLDQQMKLINRRIKSEHPEYDAGFLAAFIDPFATEDGTKRPIPYLRENGNIVFSASEMKNLPSTSPRIMEMAIEGLENSRLLRVNDDSIELAHDSLAALIDQRRTDEQRSLNNIKKRLINEFNEYQESHEPLSRKQLISFEEYIPLLNLDREILDFIHFSEKEATRKEQEELEQKRKELEVEQERRRAELMAQKAQAEKDKVEAEKQAIAAGKKARRLRNILFIFAVVILGLAVWVLKDLLKSSEERGDVLEQKNRELAEKTAEIESQKKTIELQKDSIETIFKRLQPHVDRADKLIRGEGNSSLQEQAKGLLTTSIFIRGIMNGESDKKINGFAYNAFVYQDRFFPTNQRNAFRLENPRKVETFGFDDPWIAIYAGIRAPKSEKITLRWFHEDDLQSPVQTDDGDVRFSIGSKGYGWSKPLIRANRKKGNYTVRLYNELGTQIGETKFTIK